MFIVSNFLFSTFNRRFDVSSDRLFSLSEGSLRILNDLEKPVTIRYYLSQNDNILPIELRNHADRVTDFLKVLETKSGDKLKIIFRDPSPDSAAELEAELDGLTGHPVKGGIKAYMGLSATSLKEGAAIPFLNPEREASLEFDVMNLIRSVTARHRPKAAVYSSLSTFGTKGSFAPWALMDQLNGRFSVEELSGKEELLPEDLQFLLIIHPQELSPGFERAVDTFLGKGGNLALLLDPVAISPIFYQGRSEPGTASSDWPHLLSALGLEFTADQAVLDMRLKDQIDRGDGMETLNSLLHLEDEGINRQHPISKDVQGLRFCVAGTFLGKPLPGFKVHSLLSSTTDSQLYPHQDLISLSYETGQRTLHEFQADRHRYPLALYLEGVVPSFTGSVATGRRPSQILLLSDTDFAADPFAGSMVENQGRLTFQPLSGNLGFLLNAIDSMANDTALNTARNRSQVRRPLTRLVELRRVAEEQYRSRINAVEGELRQLAEESSPERLANGSEAIGDKMGLGSLARMEEMKKKRLDLNRHLRQLKRGLRLELEGIESRIKWLNIALLPFSVILIGAVVITLRHFRTRARASS